MWARVGERMLSVVKERKKERMSWLSWEEEWEEYVQHTFTGTGAL